MNAPLPKNESKTRPSVSIWLDSYDDVFSDFDPRPFSERSLSDDFILEARKMAKEKPQGKIELKLLLPSGKRNAETEAIIIKNLHSHFRHIIHTTETEVKKARRRGIILTIVGFLLMIAAAYVISINRQNFYLNVLRVLLEPSGWFMVWAGLEDIYYGSRKKKEQLDFNLKMAQAEISFVSF